MIRQIIILEEAVPEFTEVFGKDWKENIGIDPDTNEPISNPQTKEEFAGETCDNEMRTRIERRVRAHRKQMAGHDATGGDITGLTE
jgi:hypothetical protein